MRLRILFDTWKEKWAWPSSDSLSPTKRRKPRRSNCRLRIMESLGPSKPSTQQGWNRAGQKRNWAECKAFSNTLPARPGSMMFELLYLNFSLSRSPCSMSVLHHLIISLVDSALIPKKDQGQPNLFLVLDPRFLLFFCFYPADLLPIKSKYLRLK